MARLASVLYYLEVSTFRFVLISVIKLLIGTRKQARFVDSETCPSCFHNQELNKMTNLHASLIAEFFCPNEPFAFQLKIPAPGDQPIFSHRNHFKTNFRAKKLQHARRQTGGVKLYHVNNALQDILRFVGLISKTRRHRDKKLLTKPVWLIFQLCDINVIKF